MSLNFQQTRDLLYNFQFQNLFIEELGWSQPTTKKSVTLEIENNSYNYHMIAVISGVAVFEIQAADGTIPEAKVRAAIHKEVTNLIAENLLIFLDKQRTRSLWYWVKRDGNKTYIRDHLYVKGQPGDLFLSKLGSLVVDITELEYGNPTVVEIAYKLQRGFDVEPVTKKFYKDFQEQHHKFLNYVKGINNETDRRWYTSVILNRMMFVYFLQRKGFIDHENLDYLQNKLQESKQRGEKRFYKEFLQSLFFESFAKPETERDESVQDLVGNVKYLNGGLFLKHRIEQEYKIDIADEAFEQILDLFQRYSWNLDDTPEGKDDEINPDVLGYIFEKYINQKAFGAYYTRPQITEYLCDRTIHKLIVERVNAALSDKYKPFEDINEIILKLDANICRLLIEDILPNLTILDPACGSGAFLVAAMKTLILVYAGIIGSIELQGDRRLKDWLKDVRSKHHSIEYFVKKRIISDNLYGIDIMEEATEIAKLRLFLALVASAHNVNELEPLPNIDFNIMAGNSLIGLIRVDETAFDAVGNSLQANLLQPLEAANYKVILEDKNKSIELFKKHAFIPREENLPGGETGTHQDIRLLNLRKHIEKLNQESQTKLNGLLLNEFSRLGIKYEEVQLTGKSKKRLLNIQDIEELKPFHWGYHFDKVLERGGFDAIITNPPWEIFKPQAKEFFAQHSELVTKNKMDIKAFEKEQKTLLENPEIAVTWLQYQSQYPYVSAYYRSAAQYENQISVVNGKKSGTDINLYKLFVEQCFNLLKPGGECGIVIPSGIYTDLGTKQLREMLFSRTKVTGLFCLENRKEIFEGVHRSFKFVVLTFEKGRITQEFPSAFMRHDVQELTRFPGDDSLQISVDLVRKLSPDSLSIMEFNNVIDYSIAYKLANHYQLSDENSGFVHIKFTRELAPDSKSQVFLTSPGKDLLPILEGRMIHQFTSKFSTTYRYWIKEVNARQIILGKTKDVGQLLDYKNYRLAFRKIARNTDIRTMIATVIPPHLCLENIQTVQMFDDQGNQIVSYQEILYLCAIWNSFVYDSLLRLKVSANINFFFVYGTPVPRLTEGDKYFNDIVERAAKLICTAPEFDELAQEVGLESHKNGVTDETERAQIRAELDGMIAHLYGFTEAEFSYILTTFPIVPEPVKEAALEAYRTFTPMTGDAEIIELIQQGEGSHIEFKSTARWNLRENKQDKAMEHEIVKTVAAFLNANGGTLLIGVDDDGEPLGLKNDYQTLRKQNNDGYMLFLNNDLLLREIGKDSGTLFQITFHQVSGQDVCRVIVKPSPKPVYVKVKDKSGKEEEIFYLRSNNSSVKLSTKEAVDYSNTRWTA